MQEKIFNAQLILFVVIYFLRSLLIIGYNNLKFKSGEISFKALFLQLVKTLFSKLPLTQKLLEPRGYDYKVYVRFQKRFVIYYFALWILLFSILFFAANIYLRAFN
jgi:hypothetical protein